MQGGNDKQTEKSNTFGYDDNLVGAANSQDQSTNQLPVGQNEGTSHSAISWQASEYIHHQKNASWYLGFSGVMILLIVILYLLMRDWLSLAVLFLMGIAVAVYAGRKPDTIQYSLSHSGLNIGGKHYDFDNFASYAVMQEGGVYSITLMPTKRFLPPVSIYFAPEDGERILAVLAAVMPHEERQPDIIDRLMRNIRF